MHDGILVANERNIRVHDPPEQVGRVLHLFDSLWVVLQCRNGNVRKIGARRVADYKVKSEVQYMAHIASIVRYQLTV